MQYLVTTFYKFFPIEAGKLSGLQDELQKRGESLGLVGLLLLGTEGVNCTLSGSAETVAEFKTLLPQILNCGELYFKDSLSAKAGFREFDVRLRPEIVTLGRPELVPTSPVDHHLDPQDFHRLANSGQVKILDTRNTYETDIGKFKDAIDLRIEEFREFPEKLKNSALNKDETYLIYCTGGIRCEKAILEMRSQGYEKVYQLNGGIINYLQQLPNELFEGECFVFDYRVAVDQELNPSKHYQLCPHCGQPSSVPSHCPQCGREEKLCPKCFAIGGEHLTCSKNCANHFRLGHKSRRPHLEDLKKRGRII